MLQFITEKRYTHTHTTLSAGNFIETNETFLYKVCQSKCKLLLEGICIHKLLLYIRKKHNDVHTFIMCRVFKKKKKNQKFLFKIF